MAMLVGKHVNKIDRKGRVSVPKSFRENLVDPENNLIYLFPSFNYPAIEGCDQAFMNLIGDSIEDLELFSKDRDELASFIIENACPLSIDPEGRIVIPVDLLKEVGITDQAVFVGRGRGQFQIWNPDAYAEHRGSTMESLRARGATLKLLRRAGE